MNAGKVDRRSALRLAATASASVLATGLKRGASAQAGGDLDRAIEWAKTTLPNSTRDIVAGAFKEGKLSLLLLQFGDDASITAMIDRFRGHYTFIDVSYTTQSTAQLLNKFNAEVNAKRGLNDYLQLPPGLTDIENYMKIGALADFVISQDAAFPDGAKHSGIWYSWLRQYGATAYRTGSLSDEEKRLIRTFKGLGDPRFKGRLGINGITNSTTQAGYYVLTKDPDQTILDRLVANQPRVKPSSAALMDGLLNGEYDVSLLGGFPTAANAAKLGAPVEFGITAPSPVQYAPGAISALAPHPNAARLWQDWAMSKEGQELWSSQIGSISARDDVNSAWAAQQPWFFQDRASHQEIDWRDFTARQPELIERFKKQFQGG